MVPPPEAIAMMPAIHSGDQALRIKRPHKCPRIGVAKVGLRPKTPSASTSPNPGPTSDPRRRQSTRVMRLPISSAHSGSLSSVCMLVAEWR